MSEGEQQSESLARVAGKLQDNRRRFQERAKVESSESVATHTPRFKDIASPPVNDDGLISEKAFNLVGRESAVKGTQKFDRPERISKTRFQTVKDTFKKLLLESEIQEKEKGIPRSPTTRYDREAMAAAIHAIRGDKTIEPEVLDGFTNRAREVQKKSEALDLQAYTAGKFLDVGKGADPHNGLYVVTYDGRDSENQNSVPTIFIPGATATAEQNRTVVSSRAIGHKTEVIAIEHREQRQEKAGGRGPIDKLLRNPLNQDVDNIVKGIIALKRSEVDLVGESLGGAFGALVVADKRLQENGIKIRNAEVWQPVGAERRGFFELAAEEGKVGPKNENDPERRVIMADQGNEDAFEPSFAKLHKMIAPRKVLAFPSYIAAGKAAATYSLTPEVLAEAASNVTGKFRIVNGDLDQVSRLSALTDVVAEAKRLMKDPSKLELVVVRGADHADLVVHAVGLDREINENKKIIELSDLEISWAERILKEMAETG